MKSNRQARHILGLDYRISNQRKVNTATTVGLPFNTYPAVNAAGYHFLL